MDLLKTLGQGQILELETAIQKHQDMISKFPQIVNEMGGLRQKVRIIAFLELLFKCDKDERSLSFDKIAQGTHTGKEDVELLVMKALCLDLIKGTIDQFDEVVHISWILPRYLNNGHLEIMVERLGNWGQNMEDVIRQVTDQSEELCAK